MVLMGAWAAIVESHTCIHDEIRKTVERPVLSTKPELYDAKLGRRLSQIPWSPLRFRLVYKLDDSPLGMTEKNFLQTKLVPNAANFWSNILKVKRPAKLLVEANCTHIWSDKSCARVNAENWCAGVIPIDPKYVAAHSYCSTGPGSDCETSAGGPGITDADYVLYVTATASVSCGGSTGATGSTSTLAYATSCREDSQDRPIMGYVNFCPGAVNINASEYHRQHRVALHEIAHALGFSAQSWPRFRTPSGEPRTSPLSRGPYTCADGSTQEIYRPGDTTVKRLSMRGKMAHFMVTPRVRSVARTYFQCDRLPGVELEDAAKYCLGSHWDERTMYDELMSPVAQTHREGNRLSAFTLALFEDSGWYMPDYQFAEKMLFGVGAGCNFVEKKCVSPETHTALGSPVNTFCDTSGEQSCTYDRRACGYCAMGNYVSAIPEPFRYFSDNTLGGTLRQLDYCPIYSEYANRLCTDTSNNDANQLRGNLYSADSFCAKSTLLDDGYVPNSAVRYNCFHMTCDPSSRKIFVTLDRQHLPSPKKNVTLTCQSDGEVLSNVPGFSGEFHCPEWYTICGLAHDFASGFNVTDSTSGSTDSADEERTEQLSSGDKISYDVHFMSMGWVMLTVYCSLVVGA